MVLACPGVFRHREFPTCRVVGRLRRPCPLALADIGATSSHVAALVGSIYSNVWSNQVIVSRSDASPNTVVFAGSSSGAAVLTWQIVDPTSFKAQIRASDRPNTAAAWTAPMPLSNFVDQPSGPQSAAVNAANKAVVIYGQLHAPTSPSPEYWLFAKQ